MKENKLIELAKPLLVKGVNKDFFLHTKGVLKATKMLIKEIALGDSDLLIPAAIFHDVGWSNVPKKMQGEASRDLKEQGMRLHLIEGANIVKELLSNNDYSQKEITEIARIISLHKYSNPKDINARILIDADNLSDIFKEQFSSDLVSYKSTPEKLLSFRSGNEFYFKESKLVFDKEIKARKLEYGIK